MINSLCGVRLHHYVQYNQLILINDQFYFADNDFGQLKKLKFRLTTQSQLLHIPIHKICSTYNFKTSNFSHSYKHTNNIQMTTIYDNQYVRPQYQLLISFHLTNTRPRLLQSLLEITIILFYHLPLYYYTHMGAANSKKDTKRLQRSYSTNDQYLSFYQLQRLTPPLVKSLSYRRPYQGLLHQNRKANKKLAIKEGLYEGHINENQKPAGLGKIYQENGSLLIGRFINGSLVGQHHAFNTDGSYFYGSVIDNNQKRGSVYYADGTLQEGLFTDSLLQGFGSEKTLKYKFEGQFRRGKPVRGKLTWYNDNETHCYEGSFDQNGNFTGEAKLTEPLGVYTGIFKDGKKHGRGRYQFKNGIIYEGEYIKGLKQGQGRLYNSDKSLVYEGHFDKNLPNGKGASVNTKGRKVQSQFFEGLSKRQLDMIQTMSSIDKGENLHK